MGTGNNSPEYAGPGQILVIGDDGMMREFKCPFPVFSATKFPNLKPFITVKVEGVFQAKNGKLFYWIEGEYYEYNHFRFVYDVFRHLNTITWPH